MKPALCLCEHLQPRATRHHLRVVIHDIELHKSTNTGRLLPLLLEKAALCPYGRPELPLDVATLAPPGTRPVVLYPASGAPTVSKVAASSTSPLCLIVLDGTWHQAARLRKRFAVAGIPFAQLPVDDEGSATSYALRQGNFEGSRSTLEAAARAMALIEGDDAVEEHILDPFRMLVDRILWLRGVKQAPEVYGGMPAGITRHDLSSPDHVGPTVVFDVKRRRDRWPGPAPDPAPDPAPVPRHVPDDPTECG